ncbi:hypothetical protein MMC12_003858 [Toensbergia leucococca]|nr:hypothetical protein [Toensbergia leucococca]
MAANRIEALDGMFDDHPSLSASLEDFEHNENRSPLFGLPSQHSGFKSDDSEIDAESNSDGPWSPPAWRRQNAGSGWYQHQPYLEAPLRPSLPTSPSRSRETSPQYESAREDEEDITLPANIPLPRDTISPSKEPSPSPSLYPERGQDFAENFGQTEQAAVVPENTNNYIRFAVRAEVQHRTEPIEAALSYIRTYYRWATKSRSSSSFALILAIVSFSALRLLFQTPASPPVPDLVKVAGLARSFEPLIFYSENGAHQIGDLQETGVAVWDLGESLRYANLTSAPLISQGLDDLSESLKTLAIELTKFFANVDGDIDGILIVMEWAKRELTALSALPISSLSSAFTNIHSLLSRLGVLEHPSTGLPTPIGKLLTNLFGTTRNQRTRQTLQRTFNEFLGVLEESINSELTYSTALFSLFESIDRQFLNLQRTVIRESDTQERLEGEFLSSLWSRVMGPNASMLRKYEKNKNLLSSVRAKTTQNKGLLVEHNGKLVALKGNLESLRRKLVSPLVRREDGSTVGVEEQVKGLEGTYDHLRRVRERQKGKVLEILYGAGSRRTTLGREEPVGIEAR